MLPKIVMQAMRYTVTDIGQLSKDDLKTLNKYVKMGFLAKGKGGGFPALKTIYAVPTYDFDGCRKAEIRDLFATCKSLGENVPVEFE